ncbi:MAG: RidA family protein [Alphaproteobacteria bacterium]|nr:RidA family protein [Alphaproteobacteria bacterium]
MGQSIQPAGWPKPKGYSDGIVAELGMRGGRVVFVAGQIGWLPEGRFETDDFVGQARQAFANIVAVLAAAGARPEHIGRLTWYITDKREFLARQTELGEAYRTVMGRHFPAMAVVQVVALIEDRAKVEIEATAVVPA